MHPSSASLVRAGSCKCWNQNQLTLTEDPGQVAKIIYYDVIFYIYIYSIQSGLANEKA